MRYTKILRLGVATVLIACSEAPETSVTDPNPSLRLGKEIPIAACDAALGREITSQMSDLFAKPHLSTAKALWEPVASNCTSNPSVAKEAMLTYVQFTIDRKVAGEVRTPLTGTVARAILGHWDLTFPYVGYDAPGLPDTVFTSDGAVGVIKQSTENRVLSAARAAMSVPVQNASGDARGHLFSIYRLPATDCLGDTNLSQQGPCFEFQSFPKASPRFSDGVTVGVCQALRAGDPLGLKEPALGHLKNGGTDSSFVEVPEQKEYPLICSHLASAGDPGSWSGGFSGITKRVAWLARKAFEVQPLYAVHGGLGGVASTLSPFGAVDLSVFLAPLKNEVTGSLPGAPQIGTWTDSVKSPGSIKVSSSLGNYADTMIVLSQGGGACNNCGGLLLKGTLVDNTTAKTGATYGRYAASWVSLQASPSVKGAPFVLRDGAGLVIASLSYSTESSQNRLRYNGVALHDSLAWVQNEPQSFTIQVNLNTRPRTTSLFINGKAIAAATNVPFASAATSLSNIAADFRGIDSGIMGWAEISVKRLIDQ